ncbi:hypothetical protein J1614_012237, partial [Plenodomus biglobosus]
QALQQSDVVVSRPRGNHGGVLQYDKGASEVNNLRAEGSSKTMAADVLKQMRRKLDEERQHQYDDPGPASDWLYKDTCEHQGEESDDCSTYCDAKYVVSRSNREDAAARSVEPCVHFGSIASSNQLQMSAIERNRIQREHDVVCFEMEPAGLMHEYPCVVVRGICDYADSQHKNKGWQHYAAATAAAYAKELLRSIPSRSSVQHGGDQTCRPVASQVNYSDGWRRSDRGQYISVKRWGNEFLYCERLIRRRRPDPGGEHLGTGGAVTFVTLVATDSDVDTRCLRAWRLTDQRNDRTRILTSKDLLLAGLCDRIFDDAAFAQWWEDDESRILWIHGDPGKGKTTMMAALTEEIACHVGETPDRKAGTAFFFCQNTMPELSNAAAIVRGLTFLLATEQPALWRQQARKYAEAGERLFEGFNMTLADMAQDASVSSLYLLVDALDECERDSLRTFFDLVTSPTASCKIKWVFSSRNIRSIQKQLLHVGFSEHTSLEVNSFHVSEAVMPFIRFKVNLRTYSTWLVGVWKPTPITPSLCKELERVETSKTLKTMRQLPAGLSQLYQRMLKQIAVDDGEDRGLCEALLHMIDDSQKIDELSAKDYFTTGSGCAIFSYGQPQAHHQLAHRLLSSMSQTLTTDILGVRWPGTQVQEAVDKVVRQCVQCAFFHWADHVKASRMTLEHGGVVHEFLQARLLMLFEALGWLGWVSDGMRAMRQLNDMTETGRSLQILLRDVIRFVRSSRTLIEQAPLQIYSSALIFAQENIMTLEGHADRVTSVTFSLNGQTVASRSYDKTVKLWDIFTGQVLDTRLRESNNLSACSNSARPFSSCTLSEVTLNTTPSLPEIAVGASWISWKARNLLWLPPEYRSLL